MRLDFVLVYCVDKDLWIKLNRYLVESCLVVSIGHYRSFWWERTCIMSKVIISYLIETLYYQRLAHNKDTSTVAAGLKLLFLEINL